MRINNAIPWREEQWKRIRYSYGNAKWFREYAHYFEELYGREHQKLIDFDLETTRKVLEWLGINVRILVASDLGVKSHGTMRLVEICEALGADTYLSGAGGKSYVDGSLFDAGRIKLEYDDYVPRPYKQRFGGVFVRDLSIVDMLFNTGPDAKSCLLDTGEVRLPQAA